jgi:hypothetical protein
MKIFFGQNGHGALLNSWSNYRLRAWVRQV